MVRNLIVKLLKWVYKIDLLVNHDEEIKMSKFQKLDNDEITLYT